MITDTVELFLEKHDLLKPKNNIIVAFSGGYDSMCLLHIMKQLANKYDLNLYAIHLNHNWRGAESDLDEEVCKNFASDVVFYSEKLSDSVPHTETAAREERYKFFEKCAKMYDSKIVLTAHNANDNAETVFYRIMKGTGITGLEGIKEKRDIYYRPLLSVYRDEIEDYCRENSLTPNNDSSNSDTKYERNKIRHEIFPLLPGIEEKLNSLSESARLTNIEIEKEIKPLDKYSTKDFCKLSDFYKNAVVHKFFRKNNLEYDRKKIDDVVSFILQNSKSKAGTTLSLTNNLWLFVNDKKICKVFESEKCNTELKINGEGIYNFEGLEFEITRCKNIPDKFPQDNEFRAYISMPEIDFVLRTRHDGDVIRPFGLNGTQKLKKYLNEKKIPKHERDDIILLTQGKEVLWVSGVGISDKVKVVSEPVYKVELRGKL